MFTSASRKTPQRVWGERTSRRRTLWRARAPLRLLPRQAPGNTGLFTPKPPVGSTPKKAGVAFTALRVALHRVTPA